MNTLKLGLGLIILMGVNIAMGFTNAIFVKKFDWKKLARGFVKAGILLGYLVIIYFVGVLNPDIIVIDVGGIDANLSTAVQVVMLPAYYYYGKQAIDKLVALIGGSLFDEIEGQPEAVSEYSSEES